ncbi:thymidine kinase [Murid herpesvirus 3]|uniref:Thymidine kinase n=2 Tax=Murid betaherpesvirus 3 TaxID=2560603 RepID=A0A1P8VIP8_9BETA|nr:thymidine kinase [Murine roseolovirus]APZ76229.1 thymidine kinase [Murid betaherpesvirus 3]AYH64733.1 thymidine kinase [Murid herpesvirus 3]
MNKRIANIYKNLGLKINYSSNTTIGLLAITATEVAVTTMTIGSSIYEQKEKEKRQKIKDTMCDGFRLFAYDFEKRSMFADYLSSSSSSSLSSCSSSTSQNSLSSSRSTFSEMFDVKPLSYLDIAKCFEQRPSKEEVMSFVNSVNGRNLYISWPVGFSIVFSLYDNKNASQNEYSLGAISKARWLKKLSTMMCCPEEFIQIGYITGSRYEYCPKKYDPRILYGLSSGALYAFIPGSPSSGLWRVAENFFGLATHGLERIEKMFYHPSLSLLPMFITSGPNITDFWDYEDRVDIFTFAKNNEDSSYYINYPVGYKLYFGLGSRPPTGTIVSPDTQDKLIHIARFGPEKQMAINGGPAVVGRIYGCITKDKFYARNETTGELILLASEYNQFMSVGIRPFFHNHNYNNVLYPQQAIVCHRCGKAKYNLPYSLYGNEVSMEAPMPPDPNMDPRFWLIKNSRMSGLSHRDKSPAHKRKYKLKVTKL